MLSLIYGDSFQDDEDLCNILAALQLGSWATTARDPGVHPHSTSTVIAEVPARVASDPRPSTVAGDVPATVASSWSLAPIAGATGPVAPRPTAEGSRYHVTSGKRTGVRPNWADAGDATQGVPGSKVARFRVTPPPRSRGHRAAYVVFKGLAPGVYNTWEEVEPLVKSVQGNVYQGFDHRREAEHAYVVAFTMGALHTVDPGRYVPASAAPTPEAIMAAFSAASDNFLGAEWHVVFKGKRPGIYPAWNFATTQTKGVSSAIYKKFGTKVEAEAVYREGVCHGFVQVLL